MIKVYFMKLGNCLNVDLDFKKQLKFQLDLREVSSERESDVIIAFVPIVSRAGTDIEAALKKIPESQPAVLVVLHYTFDPYFVAPVSRLSVNRGRVFTVDCLFHEDRGLLRCERNEEALREVKEHLEAMRSPLSTLHKFQILEHVWKMLIIVLIFLTTELIYAIFLVALFLLRAPLDKFFHVKWFTKFFVACILVKFVYMIVYYDIEKLILNTLFSSLEPADTDSKQKTEAIHSITQVLHNISQNINQNISKIVDQIRDQNITEIKHENIHG